MKRLSFTVPGPCVPKGRAMASAFRCGKFTKITMRTPEKTVTYEAKVYQRCVEAMERDGITPMEGPLEITVKVYRSIPKSFSKKKTFDSMAGFNFPTSKPDLDNQVKAIMDAIGGVVCGNDSAFCKINAIKRFDNGIGERVEVNVRQIKERLY